MSSSQRYNEDELVAADILVRISICAEINDNESKKTRKNRKAIKPADTKKRNPGACYIHKTNHQRCSMECEFRLN